jgi:membrane-associated phospholipid phosphatase
MKLSVFTLLTLLVATTSFAQPAGSSYLQNLSQSRTPGMTRFMQGISNTTTPICIGVPVGLFITSIITKDHDMQRKSVYIVEALGVASVLALSLKYTISRPRPSTQDSLIIPASDQGSPSFPSGHTTEAFAIATSLSLAYPKWFIIAPSFLWAATVGYSRMYLGVHYPTDVLAGAVLGSGSALLCRKINQLLFSSKPKYKNQIWF